MKPINKGAEGVTGRNEEKQNAQGKTQEKPVDAKEETVKEERGKGEGGNDKDGWKGGGI